MTMLFPVLLFVLLIMASIEFYKPTDRLQKITWLISSALVSSVIAFNRMNADFEGYQQSFLSNNPHNEIGYNYLVKLLNALHLPFESVFFLMGIMLFLIFYFYSLKQHASFAALLYLIYPLALDLPQIRNFLMYSVVLLTIYLVRDRFPIILTGGILLSATFHYFGIMFLPFVLMIKQKRKIFYWLLGGLFVLVSISVVFLRIFHVYMPEIIASEIKPFDWFYYLIQVVHIAVDMITIYWIDRKINPDRTVEPATHSLMEIMYRISLYTVIVVPLVAYSTEMYRFRRNAQIIKYLFAANAISLLKKKDRWIVIGLIVFNLAFVVFMLFVTGDLKIYNDLNNYLTNRLP